MIEKAGDPGWSPPDGRQDIKARREKESVGNSLKKGE